MDDPRKEEEDADVTKSNNHRNRPNSSSKRSSRRKNSIDATADADATIFSTPDDPNPNPSSSRSLSYPHYPPPTTTTATTTQGPHHHNVVSATSFASRRPSSDGTLTLERAMSEFGGAPGTLPEFVAAGGGSGIFRVPVRAAMHPARPPALELRPHPLRETQYGAFLRTVVSTATQLWAGQEGGLRFWTIADSFLGPVGPVKKGDEESAPFRESGKGRTSPVICMVVDEATGVIWTGHKDGKIRSWRITEDIGEGDGFGEGEEWFKEGLSWQAHRHPVLSMIISSYGMQSFLHMFTTWICFLCGIKHVHLLSEL